MGNKRKYIVSVGFMLLLFGVTYYILFSKYSLEQTLDIIGDVRLWLVGLGALCAFGYVFFEAVSLKVCMDGLGSPISVWSSVKYSMVGFYFSAITPSSSGGQPMQVYYMSRDGCAVSPSAMSMMLMSVIFKAVLLAVGLPVVFIEARLVFLGLPYFRALFALGILVMLFMMGLLLFVMFSKTLIFGAVRLVVRAGGKLRLVKNPEDKTAKLLKMVDGYHEAAGFIRQNPRLSVKVFFLTVAQRAAMFSVAWCIYRAFGMRGLSWIDVVAIQMGLSISVDQLPFPGAIGVSEGVFLGLYGGIYGSKLLVPAMVLVRGCSYYLPMIISGLITGVFHFRLLGRTEGRGKAARKGADEK